MLIGVLCLDGAGWVSTSKRIIFVFIGCCVSISIQRILQGYKATLLKKLSVYLGLVVIGIFDPCGHTIALNLSAFRCMPSQYIC